MKMHINKASATVILLSLFLFAAPAFAGSATWKQSPGSSDWDTADNWTPATVPASQFDTATFDLSNTTNVSISSDTTVSGIVFTSNAASNPFTITDNHILTIAGIQNVPSGISNNSGVTQSFITTVHLNSSGLVSEIVFNGDFTTAGTNTVFTNNAPSSSDAKAGLMVFNGFSRSGSAIINNIGGSGAGAGGGQTVFHNDAGVGNGSTINNYGGSASTAHGGTTSFLESSGSLDSATINNYAGSVSGADGGETIFGVNTLDGGVNSGTINNFGSSVSGALAGHTEFNELAGSGGTINNNASTASGDFGGQTEFHNTSIATGGTINNNGASVAGTFNTSTQFFDSSQARAITINNDGAAAANAAFGETVFHNTSSAGDFLGQAIINNNAGTASTAPGGETEFRDFSRSGGATINNNGGGLGAAGETLFRDQSAANGSGESESHTTINNKGGSLFQAAGGFTEFLDNSTASTALINNSAGTASGAHGGQTRFYGMSSAGFANINNNGASGQGPHGGETDFFNSSTADSATISSNGGIGLLSSGGETIFHDSSDAGASTLIANSGRNFRIFPGIGFGGEILFNDNSTGGTSRVEVFGNGIVDISGHSAPGVTIGSVEGSGNVFLGSNNLSVGSNNRDSAFSGVIHDGAFGGGGGSGGSVTKIGTGTLFVSGTNTYTGATTVNAGTLLVDGSIASSSGVSVAVGATLGGHGNVSSISGAGTISPGDSPGILTATQLNPSGGTGFLFEFTQTGSPTYSNAAASGNDLLDLTGLTPFTTALSSANQITIDFSGASLVAGEMFRGGFFTDTATTTSEVSNATFLYTGLNGFTVHFDGFVTEPIAAFASTTVINGTVLEFDIVGGGGGGGSTVPDSGSSGFLFGLALAGCALSKYAREHVNPLRRMTRSYASGQKWHGQG